MRRVLKEEFLVEDSILSLLSNREYNPKGFWQTSAGKKCANLISKITRNSNVKYEAHHISGIHPTDSSSEYNSVNNIAVVPQSVHKQITKENNNIVDAVLSKALGGCDKYIARNIIEILLYAENNNIDLTPYAKIDNAVRDKICNQIIEEIQRNFYTKYSQRDDVFLLSDEDNQFSVVTDKGRKKARGKRWTIDMVN